MNKIKTRLNHYKRHLTVLLLGVLWYLILDYSNHGVQSFLVIWLSHAFADGAVKELFDID